MTRIASSRLLRNRLDSLQPVGNGLAMAHAGPTPAQRVTFGKRLARDGTDGGYQQVYGD